MRARPITAVTLGLALLVGCGVARPGVEATRSRQIDNGKLIKTNEPTDTTPGATTPETVPTPVQQGVIDFGSNKEPHDFDGYLTAALSDIEAYWAQEFPTVYGSEFTPLSGGIYAAYPDRTEPIPGCGGERTSQYSDIKDNAFYCVDGDFIAYDDASLLPQLVEQLGQSAVGVVMAHEFGHAVQSRAQEFNQPTILKEQQADCFAGAWAAHVARGEAPGLTFNDDDIKAGLIAMIQVRDPVKLSGTVDESSHGTGFDRVGAFQDGFIGGAERCRTFFTEGRENQLINIAFDTTDLNQGNLPLIDPNPGPKGPNDIQTLIPANLTRYWTEQLQTLGVTFTAPKLTIVPIGGDPPTCDGVDAAEFRKNVKFCPSSDTIFVDQQFAEESVQDPLLGDLSIGYLISQGYSEDVQTLLGSTLTGSQRALADDCLSGAWAKDVIPPIPTDRTDTTQLSAGDLDEAIVTAILSSDPTADTNVNGTAFDKVKSFREGVFNGFSACQARIKP
jgi:predicted metalloprotease